MHSGTEPCNKQPYPSRSLLICKCSSLILSDNVISSCPSYSWSIVLNILLCWPLPATQTKKPATDTNATVTAAIASAVTAPALSAAIFVLKWSMNELASCHHLIHVPRCDAMQSGQPKEWVSQGLTEKPAFPFVVNCGLCNTCDTQGIDWCFTRVDLKYVRHGEVLEVWCLRDDHPQMSMHASTSCGLLW